MQRFILLFQSHLNHTFSHSTTLLYTLTLSIRAYLSHKYSSSFSHARTQTHSHPLSHTSSLSRTSYLFHKFILSLSPTACPQVYPEQFLRLCDEKGSEMEVHGDGRDRHLHWSSTDQTSERIGECERESVCMCLFFSPPPLPPTHTHTLSLSHSPILSLV